MAKIIGTSKKTANKKFEIGDWVVWIFEEMSNRGYWESKRYYGTVIKVCPVNLHVEDPNGYIWSVGKTEVI